MRITGVERSQLKEEHRAGGSSLGTNVVSGRVEWYVDTVFIVGIIGAVLLKNG